MQSRVELGVSFPEFLLIGRNLRPSTLTPRDRRHAQTGVESSRPKVKVDRAESDWHTPVGNSTGQERPVGAGEGIRA
jgi:hypothetical protein